MLHRTRVVLILSVIALATTAAATAAIRWQVWTPPSACLMCEAPTSDAAAALGNGGNGGGTGNGAGSYARSSAGTFVPGPLNAGSPSADAMARSSARAGSAPKGWQPWGTGSGSFRVSSSGAGGPSTSLGGLWKLMSLSRPGHAGGGGGAGAGESGTVARNTPKPPAASRPSPKPGTPRSSPSAPPASPSFTAGSPTLAGPAPSSGAAATDPFHEHETPAPDPFVPPTGGGGFDPGRPGGLGPGAGGGGRVAATPEPGSILLVGTGLLGILGVIRKRRLI